MRRLRLLIACSLVMSNLCVTNLVGQEKLGYPQDASDIIFFVETFSRVDLSVKDTIRNLGTVNRTNDDDKHQSILLTPFPSHQTLIKKIVLDVFESKPNRVTIEYTKPILISYGTLREKYGPPRRLAPPVVECKRGVKCQPSFVGYSFGYVPAPENISSGQRLEVYIDLEMEWSKEVPQHTDKDFLAVKEILFRRISRDK